MSGIIYAWFPQAGRLPVKIPEGETVSVYLGRLIEGKVKGWIELEDGSYANLAQIVRLQPVVAEDE